ncbi:hypothetical protein FIBSPDRAFT_903278 [Athelia psychrophila]|uniref:Uncharacterized protein n=1 Tax=Athelia psychrophila TaxID=1759441 RepID=A0A167W6N9_9AGAM|nr:hypothetical protein FIBSPDRAFT_903278 [Fibularhizoctonia sp. CBS 109695]
MISLDANDLVDDLENDRIVLIRTMVYSNYNEAGGDNNASDALDFVYLILNRVFLCDYGIFGLSRSELPLRSQFYEIHFLQGLSRISRVELQEQTNEAGAAGLKSIFKASLSWFGVGYIRKLLVTGFAVIYLPALAKVDIISNVKNLRNRMAAEVALWEIQDNVKASTIRA